MMNIRLGMVEIPIKDYASQGNAVLGIRDSGKTYTATNIAEQLLDNNIPIVVFDPIGVWRFLKVPGKGKNPKGYPVVVAGGEHGDISLTPESAPEIVRAAMADNIPIVLDLYSMDMSKADWKKIVESCVRLLLYENKSHGLRHIFIEEAAEFCPQRIQPGDGRVYAEIEKLARMGGNASLGLTLINQRSEEVNKAVLELCDLLLLHRQRGRNSLTALEKWLRFSEGDSKAISKNVPNLGAGECYIWPQGQVPTLTQIQEKRSFHPDRKNPELVKSAKPAVDVQTFVSTIKQTLATKKAMEEDDPDNMAQTIQETSSERDTERISELESENSKLSEQISQLTEHNAKLLLRHESLRASLIEMSEEVKRVKSSIGDGLSTCSAIDARITFLMISSPTEVLNVPDLDIGMENARRIPHRDNSSFDRKPFGKSGEKIARSEMAILRAAVQRFKSGKSSSRAQLGILSGYSITSSSFSNAMGALRSRGWLEGSGDNNSPTNAGIKAAGDVPDPPRGRDLFKAWCSNARLGRADVKILEAVYASGRNGATPFEIGERSGYSTTSSSFSNALGKLRTLELIQRGNPIRISPDLL